MATACGYNPKRVSIDLKKKCKKKKRRTIRVRKTLKEYVKM